METWWEVDIDAGICSSMLFAAYGVYVCLGCWNITYTLYYSKIARSRARPVPTSKFLGRAENLRRGIWFVSATILKVQSAAEPDTICISVLQPEQAIIGRTECSHPDGGGGAAHRRDSCLGFALCVFCYE
jgi:hypothetical protein